MARIGKIVLPTKTTNVDGETVTYADTGQLENILNKIVAQLDSLSGGQMAAKYSAASAPPTGTGKTITTNPTGQVFGITWDVGDFIPAKTPTVTTANGHTYVLQGWVCTVGGNAGTSTPPTFQACYSVVGPF